ncbi:hypothetical protein HDV63DRAFT_151788 [Trichoderma sp. SZMC 28014]
MNSSATIVQAAMQAASRFESGKADSLLGNHATTVRDVWTGKSSHNPVLWVLSLFQCIMYLSHSPLSLFCTTDITQLPFVDTTTKQQSCLCQGSWVFLPPHSYNLLVDHGILDLFGSLSCPAATTLSEDGPTTPPMSISLEYAFMDYRLK